MDVEDGAVWAQVKWCQREAASASHPLICRLRVMDVQRNRGTFFHPHTLETLVQFIKWVGSCFFSRALWHKMAAAATGHQAFELLIEWQTSAIFLDIVDRKSVLPESWAEIIYFFHLLPQWSCTCSNYYVLLCWYKHIYPPLLPINIIICVIWVLMYYLV